MASSTTANTTAQGKNPSTAQSADPQPKGYMVIGLTTGGKTITKFYDAFSRDDAATKFKEKITEELDSIFIVEESTL